MRDFEHVYEPSNDTFLLLDGILVDTTAALERQETLGEKGELLSSSSSSSWNIMEIGTVRFFQKQLFR
jgi:hypothetical protein